LVQQTRVIALLAISLGRRQVRETLELKQIEDETFDNERGSGIHRLKEIRVGKLMRHNEIRRTVEEIPSGVRTTTESDSPDLAALLEHQG
jgi:hypothetical protein